MSWASGGCQACTVLCWGSVGNLQCRHGCTTCAMGCRCACLHHLHWYCTDNASCGAAGAGRPRYHRPHKQRSRPIVAAVAEMMAIGQRVLAELQPGAEHKLGFHKPPFNSVHHLQ